MQSASINQRKVNWVLVDECSFMNGTPLVWKRTDGAFTAGMKVEYEVYSWRALGDTRNLALIRLEAATAILCYGITRFFAGALCSRVRDLRRFLLISRPR